jgi:hypothetical protein
VSATIQRQVATPATPPGAPVERRLPTVAVADIGPRPIPALSYLTAERVLSTTESASSHAAAERQTLGEEPITAVEHVHDSAEPTPVEPPPIQPSPDQATPVQRLVSEPPRTVVSRRPVAAPPSAPVQRAATESGVRKVGFGAPLTARPETVQRAPLTVGVDQWATARVAGAPVQRTATPQAANRPNTGGFGAPLQQLPATAGAPIRHLQRSTPDPATQLDVQREAESLPDAGEAAVAAGVAQRSADGSVHFDPAPPPVQRAEAPTAAAAPGLGAPDGGAPGAGAAPGGNIDELVRRLYDPLAARLKAELRLDRERAGLVTDLRR